MSKLINVGLIGLLVVNMLYVFGGAFYYPLQSMDAYGIWFLKAKAFFVEQGMPDQFLHDPHYTYSHQQYPLGLPFLVYGLYLLLGGIHEKVIVLLYPLFYMAILLLAYTVLRRVAQPTLALLFTYVYSMLGPLVAAGGRVLAGNADIILLLIEWVIIFLIYQKKLTLRRSIGITLLIMLAGQIKNEGAFLSILLLLLPLKPRFKLTLLLASLLPVVGWQLYIHQANLPSDIHFILPPTHLAVSRALIILKAIGKELINLNNWYVFWPLILALMFTKPKLSPLTREVLLPAYGIMILMFALIYLFSNLEVGSYIASSFDRVLLQHSGIILILFSEKMTGVFQTVVKKTARSNRPVR